MEALAIGLLSFWLEATRDSIATVALVTLALALGAHVRLAYLRRMYRAYSPQSLPIASSEHAHMRCWLFLRTWLSVAAVTLYTLTMLVGGLAWLASPY